MPIPRGRRRTAEGKGEGEGTQQNQVAVEPGALISIKLLVLKEATLLHSELMHSLGVFLDSLFLLKVQVAAVARKAFLFSREVQLGRQELFMVIHGMLLKVTAGQIAVG